MYDVKINNNHSNSRDMASDDIKLSRPQENRLDENLQQIASNGTRWILASPADEIACYERLNNTAKQYEEGRTK